MKKIFFLLILLLSLLITACQGTISESAMETAVSQVILTSSASETTADQDSEVAEQPDIQPEINANENLEELIQAKADLKDAETKLTEQAAQISDLQSELDQIYPLLTPTITPTPFNTPTPAVVATATPKPTATVFTLPYYHKYVTPITKAPLYYFNDKNDSGYPIMEKTEPVVKFVAGDVFVVDINRVRGDGGGFYYLVIGPKNAGYYVLFDDVQDYRE